MSFTMVASGALEVVANRRSPAPYTSFYGKGPSGDWLPEQDFLLNLPRES